MRLRHKFRNAGAYNETTFSLAEIFVQKSKMFEEKKSFHFFRVEKKDKLFVLFSFLLSDRIINQDVVAEKRRWKRGQRKGLKNNLHLNDVDDDGAIMQISGSKAEDKPRNQYSFPTNPFRCPEVNTYHSKWCNPYIHRRAYNRHVKLKSLCGLHTGL